MASSDTWEASSQACGMGAYAAGKPRALVTSQVASRTERSAVVAASQRSLSQWSRQAEASTAAAIARKTKVKGRRR